MEDSEDIKRLLSEIRDIQKAHYERYLAFTEELLESERRTSAENERSLREYETNVSEAKAFREEVRRMAGMRQRTILVCGIALIVFVIAVAGLSFLASILVTR
jgi:hypothetical protein